MRSEKGFTIVEILVALAIGAIVMAAAYSMYISQQKSYQINEEVVALQQNLRAAMYFLERDLRMAGYNPTRSTSVYFGFTDIALPSPALFRFGTDTSEDGVLDPGETVTYSWENNSLKRDTGGGAQVIADNISGVSFNWFNRDGGTPANGSEVRRVGVTLTASDGKHTRELNTMVLCRNMGL
jgi:type IV pilus assembly protein PilW